MDYDIINKIIERIRDHRCADYGQHKYACCEYIADDVKGMLIAQEVERIGKLQCGCSDDEFGCQGYHGT